MIWTFKNRNKDVSGNSVAGQKKQIIEIYLISLTILCYLFRSSIPEFKYPFILLFFGLLVYCLAFKREKIFYQFSGFIREYYLAILLVVILIFSFLLSNKIYLLIFKDVINSIILLALLFLISFLVLTKDGLMKFYNVFFRLIVIFAFIISLDELFRILNIFTINPIVEINASLLTYKGIDYNFALLPVFLGMTGVLYLMTSNKSKLLQIVYNLFLLFFSISVFLSSSRRGMIILGSVLFVLLLAQFFSFSKKKIFIKKIGENSRVYLVLLASFTILSFFLITRTSYLTKNRFLEKIGSKNILSAKVTIASRLFKYYQFIDKEILLSDFYNLIWTPEFDPRDPESSWGRRMHKTIFPLTGKGTDIVPPGSKGYLMDSTCDASRWSGNALSYTVIGDAKSEKDTIIASVFCYVSEDFNGSWARIIAGKGETTYANGKLYDLNNKGVWQKLTCKVFSPDNDVSFLMYFAKHGVNDFSTLKGFIVFAYPQIEITGKGEVVYASGRKKQIIDRKSQDRDLNYLKTKSVPPEYYSAGLFLTRFNALGSLMQNPGDQDDMVRKFTSRLVSEDTTYYGYKSDFSSQKVRNDFSELRIAYYHFALQIFIKEFNLRQKLTGGGFAFLNWYGYYFSNDKTKIDYPHNPVLSIFLYSGVIGLVLYLIFIYKVFFYYMKYILEYPLFIIFFLITFFFSFFSGGSPFDPPVMGFFALLPFFIHSVHKRNPELNVETNK
jgi:hypothetical protein